MNRPPLTNDEKQVIRDLKLKGLSHKDIAKSVGCASSTVTTVLRQRYMPDARKEERKPVGCYVENFIGIVNAVFN